MTNVSGQNAAWVDSAEGVYRTERIVSVQHDCLPIRGTTGGAPIATSGIDLSNCRRRSRQGDRQRDPARPGMTNNALTLEDVLGLAVAASRHFHDDADEPTADTFGSAERQALTFILWHTWRGAPSHWRLAISGALGSIGDEWADALDAALSAGRRLTYERHWQQRTRHDNGMSAIRTGRPPAPPHPHRTLARQRRTIATDRAGSRHHRRRVGHRDTTRRPTPHPVARDHVPMALVLQRVSMLAALPDIEQRWANERQTTTTR